MDVRGNKGDQPSMSVLVAALGKGCCPRLAHLSLGHNALGDVGLAHLAGGMLGGGLRALRSLNLAEAGVSTDGVRSLARALGMLLHPPMPLEGTADGHGPVPPAPGMPSALESLDLADNHLYPQGAEALALAVAQGGLPGLRRLVLARNRIYGDGTAALTEALAEGRCPHLEHLDVRGNKIGSKGAAAVGELLRVGGCPSLASLDVGGNYLYSEGMALLAAAVVQAPQPRLASLDVEDNAMTVEGAFLLAEAVGQGAVSGLEVSWCLMGGMCVSPCVWMRMSWEGQIAPTTPLFSPYPLTYHHYTTK